MEEKNRYPCFIIFVPFFLLWLSPAHSQPTNDSLYTHMLGEFANTLETPVNSIQGILFPEDSSLFSRDTSSHISLNFAEPEISYLLIAKKVYQRQMDIKVQLRDSIARQKTLQYVDTLGLLSLKQIRKRSRPALKGDNPTLWGKWIKPALLISTGIGGIFALFFLRSD